MSAVSSKSRHLPLSLARNSVSLPVLTAALIAGFAAPVAADEAAIDLGTVKVEDASKYKAGQASSPKYTAPLLNTPQTVTVVNKEIIAEQNLMNLRDILATTVPGITFGAGEGGGGYGDSINLRGYTASSDITLDGVRDSAQYTRSDPFNLERIEVINGASSVYAGAGSVGGTINMVSKTPTGEEFAVVTAGAGTDNYGRLTFDGEHPLDDGISLRLNAMLHHNDVAGRDVEKFERWGFAPSLKIGVDRPTTFTLSYFYQHDFNVPQYGVPYYTNAFNTGLIPGASSSNYYGYANMDRQKIDVHMLTGLFEHKFSEALELRNLTRWSKVTQYSLVNPPQGTWCLASGINVSTGVACAPAGFYTPTGPRGTTRDSTNKTFYNQTDLTWRVATGDIRHTLVVGAAFLNEDFDLRHGNSQRTAAEAAPAYPPMNIANPDNIYTGPVNFFLSRTDDGEMQNQAVYAFDRIEIGPQFEINAGLRYEHIEAQNLRDTYALNILTTPGTTFRNENDLFSYRIGAIYKPVENASLYVAYGNSKTPSQAAVNGTCNATSCGVGPETAVNYEVGGKWDAMDGALSLTLAWFRNERTNYKVASNDPTQPDQQLDGSAYVQGISFGVAGAITPEWQVFANYTYLDSEVTQAVSGFCLANPAVPACVAAIASTANNQPLVGNPLTNTPEHAFAIWSTYQLPAGFQVGAGLTYQGAFYLDNNAAPNYRSDDYIVARAMVAYQVNDNLGLQLNVNNLFDESYYNRIRNNGWATPGEGRQITITGTYRL